MASSLGAQQPTVSQHWLAHAHIRLRGHIDLRVPLAGSQLSRLEVGPVDHGDNAGCHSERKHDSTSTFSGDHWGAKRGENGVRGKVVLLKNVTYARAEDAQCPPVTKYGSNLC